LKVSEKEPPANDIIEQKRNALLAAARIRAQQAEASQQTSAQDTSAETLESGASLWDLLRVIKHDESGL